MATNNAFTYEQIYGMVRNGYTGDSTIWDKTYDYIRLHPKELFQIAPNRKWSIGHQLIFHGALKLFKRLLDLYNEQNPINIFSATKDSPKPLTILDIANDRKAYYKEQYEYIEHLFAQDKFIQACRAYNWPVIDEMLNRDRKLLNEKPPYYSNYFAHYLVLNGDARKLAEYNFPNNKLQFDLPNANRQTAFDLARDSRDESLAAEIQQLMRGSRSSPDRSRDDRDVRDDDRRTPPPHFSSASNPQHTAPKPAVLSSEMRKKITCPLAKQIFVDPVIASDGHTYERRAIMEHFRKDRYSPATGDVMDDTYRDDVEMKNQIRLLRQQKLIQ